MRRNPPSRRRRGRLDVHHQLEEALAALRHRPLDQGLWYQAVMASRRAGVPLWLTVIWRPESWYGQLIGRQTSEIVRVYDVWVSPDGNWGLRAEGHDQIPGAEPYKTDWHASMIRDWIEPPPLIGEPNRVGAQLRITAGDRPRSSNPPGRPDDRYRKLEREAMESRDPKVWHRLHQERDRLFNLAEDRGKWVDADPWPAVDVAPAVRRIGITRDQFDNQELISRLTWVSDDEVCIELVSLPAMWASAVPGGFSVQNYCGEAKSNYEGWVRYDDEGLDYWLNFSIRYGPGPQGTGEPIHGWRVHEVDIAIDPSPRNEVLQERFENEVLTEVAAAVEAFFELPDAVRLLRVAGLLEQDLKIGRVMDQEHAVENELMGVRGRLAGHVAREVALEHWPDFVPEKLILSNPRLYHRSPRKIDEFDPGRMRFGDYGPGFYFSEQPAQDYVYGQWLHEADVDVSKPLDLETHDPKQINKVLRALRVHPDDLFEGDPPLVQAMGLAQTAVEAGVYRMPAVINVLEKLGYDGIVVPSKGYWSAFRPGQINVRSAARKNPGRRDRGQKPDPYQRVEAARRRWEAIPDDEQKLKREAWYDYQRELLRAGARTYSHDCPGCRFLETVVVGFPLSGGRRPRRKRPYDFYYCEGAASSGLGGSIVGRHSNEGGGYWSLPLDILLQLSRTEGPRSAVVDTAIDVALKHGVME